MTVQWDPTVHAGFRALSSLGTHIVWYYYFAPGGAIGVGPVGLFGRDTRSSSSHRLGRRFRIRDSSQQESLSAPIISVGGFRLGVALDRTNLHLQGRSPTHGAWWYIRFPTKVPHRTGVELFPFAYFFFASQYSPNLA